MLVKPNEGVSTAEAYGAIDKKDWIRHPNKELALKALVDGDIHEFFSYSANVFEQVIDAGARVEIKSVMRAHNCLYASMTGSGSAVFGVFMDKGRRRLFQSAKKQLMAGIPYKACLKGRFK